MVFVKKYPTDLTDSQWNHIKDLFPEPKAIGRPREIDFRQVVNAILYLLFTGCQWRFIPNDYPSWQSVYGYFRAWQDSGLWFRLHETLRSDLREKEGRHKHPTAGSLDSQSVKTTAVPSSRGFDAGKKIMGRKRHILVDTLGLMVALVVTTACVQDRDGLKKLLRTCGVHRKKLRKIWVDGGYRRLIIQWVKARFRYCLEVVLRSDEMKGFVVLPRRWVVERTFAWLNNHRRLSKDYERFTKTSKTMIQIAMMRLMLRRLKPF
ncbi:MAG: IS5 family transposase [Acidobacteriota bacterium]